MKDFLSFDQDARLVSYDAVPERGRSMGHSRADVASRLAAKRALDILVLLLSLVFVVPVIGLCALITAMDGGSPFFGHKRIGQNGREFRCWKIRSMVVDSQSRLAAHLAAHPKARREWEMTRKLTDDPRVTRFGRFLRKSSLDELPQLLNVFLGQMSIVGPRPVPSDELAMYGASQQTYLALRPGITGLWQVNGRNSVSYAARVAMDQEYRRTQSLKLDLLIIVKTVGVVLNRNGH